MNVVMSIAAWADIFDATALDGGDPCALPFEALESLQVDWSVPERVEAVLSQVIPVPLYLVPLTYRDAIELLQTRN